LLIIFDINDKGRLLTSLFLFRTPFCDFYNGLKKRVEGVDKLE